MLIYGADVYSAINERIKDEGKIFIVRQLSSIKVRLPWGDDAYHDYLSFCEKNNLVAGDAKSAGEWIESCSLKGWVGAEWFLASIMNEKENLNLCCKEGIIGIQLVCPWEMDESIKNLTKERFENIMDKYLKIITDEKIPLEINITDWD